MKNKNKSSVSKTQNTKKKSKHSNVIIQIKKMLFKLKSFICNDHIEILVIVLALFVASIAYCGHFTQGESHHIFLIGNMGEKFIGNHNDYTIEIKYTAKGAFIAGEPIDVSATLIWVNDSYRRQNFIIVFPNSIPYPAPENLSCLRNGQINLTYVDDRNATGETKISYLMPGGQNIELVYFPPKGNPLILKDCMRESVYTVEPGSIRKSEMDPIIYSYQEEFNLMWDDRPGNYISIGHELNVAPLEAHLQIKSNNTMLALTIIIIGFMILQLVLQQKKRRQKQC